MGSFPSEFNGVDCATCGQSLPACKSWCDFTLQTIDRLAQVDTVCVYLGGKYYRVKGSSSYYCPTDFWKLKEDFQRQQGELNVIGKPEIVLYEHHRYSGKALSLTTAAPNFVYLNFNDKASSIEVKSGVWTVYQHANYEGRRLTLKAGKYDYEFIAGRIGNDEISSARPAKITLYEHSDFQGKTLDLYDDAQNLVPLGFNDDVSSIEVSYGDWTVYEHADYQGWSLNLWTGKYNYDYIRQYMGNDVISSVRLIPGA